MGPRMIADSFSVDVYCAFLNLPQDEAGLELSEGNREMNSQPASSQLVSRQRDVARPSRKLSYVLPRLFWMAIGPGFMMVLSVLKLESRSAVSGSLDDAFLAVVVGMIVVRWGTWLAGDRCDSFGGKASFQGLLGFTGLVTFLAWSFWALAKLAAIQH